ncbi:hypothetical protein ES288_A04G065000v1, partial [Gossypium darwinii]
SFKAKSVTKGFLQLLQRLHPPLPLTVMLARSLFMIGPLQRILHTKKWSQILLGGLKERSGISHIVIQRLSSANQGWNLSVRVPWASKRVGGVLIIYRVLELSGSNLVYLLKNY